MSTDPRQFLFSGIFLAASLLPSFGQGDLIPPGPPASSMKTLQQVEPRIPISRLPFTITNSGSYYLTSNLTGQAGSHGITVNAENVTVDLNGFALLGVEGSMDGVLMPFGYRNFSLRNGTIRGWGGSGVNLPASNVNSILENLRIDQSGGVGIKAGQSSIVRDCAVAMAGSHGISTQHGCMVADCIVSSCTGCGISAGDFSRVHRCLVTFCQDVGIRLNQGGTISECQVSNGGKDGIQVDNRCRIVHNHSLLNGPNGSDLAAGIHATGSLNHIENNTTLTNNDKGIKVTMQGGGTAVVRNRSSGQGEGNYDIAAVNNAAPVTSAANATHPLANIE